MRHIATLIAALVVAPLAWVLLALGQGHSATVFADAGNGTLRPDDFVRPLLFLAAAGLLLGMLGSLHFSPLGALVMGAAYTLSNTLLLVSPSWVLDLFADDASLAGRHVDLAAPIRTGTAMVLGVLLLVGALSMRRWRRPARAGDPVSEPVAERDRPVGIDGLGLTPPYQDAEAVPVRYAVDPDAPVRPTAPAGSSNYGW
ncbi:hypothetical protein GCM10010399_88920 [Dactylosporangium fulvum]|uniref:Uncharacterized protein n=1 Tax=Dactylosporangium fulvum TaxID=53359 RepID=A0ABY5VPN6_9ACTN|nr:hypothetical protein [Dactylosporangium fulvum]UWP79011.1 hypothetical protein Dfulv_28010 [Dactylosporangium fulvum]